MSKLSPVPFHGDTIFCVEHNGEPYAPVRHIVENPGLSWAAQTVKLNSNRKRWGVAIIETPFEIIGQNTLCMPVRKLPAYLASINPKKVCPELRERVELYQEECDDALWNYWTKGHAERTPATLTPFIQIKVLPKARRDQLNELTLAKLTHVPPALIWKVRMSIWKAFNRHFAIPQYCLLPENRMAEAISFLSEMEVGSRCTVARKSAHLPLPLDEARQAISALTACIEQARNVLAALPESQRQETI